MGFHPFRVIGPYLPDCLFNVIKAVYRHYAVDRRAKLSFSNVEDIVRGGIFPNIYTSDNNTNALYSLSEVLKKYAGLPLTTRLQGVIEHGLYGSEAILGNDVAGMKKGVITMGEHRKLTLESLTNEPVYFVGPYIHYAPFLLSGEELEKEQGRLGRNLLVFPYHSFGDSEACYDMENFADYIADIGKSYDTIRICLHWKDILNGVHLFYRARGYECVTAGNAFDPYFLSRLKSIIECSAMTMSNGMGTHVGYCIHLGKSHHFFPQKVNYTNAEKTGINYGKNAYEASPLFAELLDKLSVLYSGGIPPDAYEIANKIFGMDCIKTKEELKTILFSLV